MADITMCVGVRGAIVCEIKEQCYRHTAAPNPYRQSYFMEIPLVFVNGEQQCDEFTDNKHWQTKPAVKG